MTVLENLELGTYLRNDKAEISRDLKGIYEHFPVLNERHRQAAGTLSGGEQQMLAIARALMCSPEILVLDEPSQGLAPVVIREVFQRVRKLNDLGLTVLLIEQNVVDSLRICHHAHVLEHGRLVLAGTGEEVLKDPAMRDAYLGLG